MQSTIIIPSYRRANRLLQTKNTLTDMPIHWRERTALFVREEEREAYERTADVLGVRLVSFVPSMPAYSSKVFGWGHTMDAIFDKYTTEQERFVVMDDDLALFNHDHGKYSPIDWDAMMEALLSTDEEYPLASILPRQFSQDHVDPVEYNTRMMQVFSVFSDKLRYKYRFARDSGMMYMTDMFFTLNTLQHGVKNKVYTTFVRNDVPNTPGGCLALGRDAASHGKDAFRLRQHFPHLVTLYQKEAGNWEKGTIGTRVQWRKAYRPAE